VSAGGRASSGRLVTGMLHCCISLATTFPSCHTYLLLYSHHGTDSSCASPCLRLCFDL
jgi:hypothetical protein